MSITLSKRENILGATMMVTGCCVGAGMIGLPVLSAAAGFLPSFLAIVFSCVASIGTGLILLEATLWFEGRVNLLSIAEFAFGRWGKAVVGVLFLFLFYGIFVAYLDGSGQLFTALIPSRELSLLLSVIGVGATIYLGAHGVDRINRYLMVGLILSYGLIVAMGVTHVEPKNLNYRNWMATIALLPILFISFGYQNLVPSLTHYLRKNVAAIRTAICLGNAIPLGIYCLWNFVILGSVRDPSASGHNLVTDLLQGSALALAIQWFSFFALFTSFITVGLSFVDFLRDGFRKPPHELLLIGMVLFPPLLISLLIPNLFLRALSFAGGFIDVLLFGIFPVLTVWVGRYWKKIEGPYRVGGGKLFLGLVLFLSIAFLGLRHVST